MGAPALTFRSQQEIIDQRIEDKTRKTKITKHDLKTPHRLNSQKKSGSPGSHSARWQGMLRITVVTPRKVGMLAVRPWAKRKEILFFLDSKVFIFSKYDLLVPGFPFDFWSTFEETRWKENVVRTGESLFPGFPNVRTIACNFVFLKAQHVFGKLHFVGQNFCFQRILSQGWVSAGDQWGVDSRGCETTSEGWRFVTTFLKQKHS